MVVHEDEVKMKIQHIEKFVSFLTNIFTTKLLICVDN